MTQGEDTKITGTVPTMHCTRLSLRIPQRTLVGQSGPPTRTATLGRVKPFPSRILSTARVATLSTLTSCCIFTDLPSTYPTRYWPTTAVSLSTKLTATAMPTPRPYPQSVCFARADMTIPEHTYTGIPGTGGAMSSRKPTIKKTLITTPSSSSRSVSLSQERNTKVPFATPMESTKNAWHRMLTLERILTKLRFCTAAKMR
mmetsp:Transcript_35555/g.98414  ORF Transcript_35555/g.98414 Transcript_35555/m.98414 type:complete len:201 (-) Transcript_35555:1456-2058(-)